MTYFVSINTIERYKMKKKKIKYNTQLTLLTKTVFFSSVLVFMIACSSNKPHEKQYLINKNYLTTIGLGQSANFIDMKGSEPIRNIHIGLPSNPTVENFMSFDADGHLLAVQKEKSGGGVQKMVDFRYDQHGRLRWIIPNTQYFTSLEYDSLRIEYKKDKPCNTIAISKNVEIWDENIVFDDKLGSYLFSRDLNESTKLYNLYQFNNNNLIAEYHHHRLSDNNIDSTKYDYKNNILRKKNSVFNAATISAVDYDELGRPLKGVTRFLGKDSIAWEDNYFYLHDSKLPHSIVTTSPLGWRDEINFYWETYP